jgi:NAD(P)-dependent dehydrogenase (short-subunit alcohol dehydrogenase family)
MSELRERVAIVTGAGRGIGRAIADSLGASGCRLALCSRTDGAEVAARELAREGVEAFGCRIDVSRPDELRSLVSEVLSRYGQVDILVNNAGVNHSGSVATMQREKFDVIFATNVAGVFFATQAVVPAMSAQRSGRIVNIASFVGRRPMPLYTAYAASKAAVLSLTQGMALELAEHDINVNAVCPGNVWSDIWESSTVELSALRDKSAREFFSESIAGQPLPRPLSGQEVAAAVVYLCSDATRNMTGEALYLSGGL